MELDLFEKTWNRILKIETEEKNPYARECHIPLGTLRPFYEYSKEIPEEEIVYMNFDSVQMPLTARKPLNLLILGGSGDQKSLFLKLIWSILHDAGYYCVFVDPKSTDVGRARIGWKNNLRMPPKLKPYGIKLKHYIPAFAIKDFDHYIHNFEVYSLRLQDFHEKEMWMGLGVTKTGASKIARIVKNNPNINLEHLFQEALNMKEEKEIKQQTLESIYSLMVDLEDFNFLDEKFPRLDLMKDFEQRYSVCISYNSAGITYMTFDIGQKIHQCARYYFEKNNRNPIMFFLDDAGYYAKEKKEILKYNYAIQEIINIGRNYRSLGLNNCLAVQSLNMIDENVAESYNYKIITPSFAYPESLQKIGIPKQAINKLKEGLFVDRANHTQEFLLITPDGRVIPFFAFMPPVNHFQEVYHAK